MENRHELSTDGLVHLFRIKDSENTYGFNMSIQDFNELKETAKLSDKETIKEIFNQLRKQVQTINNE